MLATARPSCYIYRISDTEHEQLRWLYLSNYGTNDCGNNDNMPSKLLTNIPHAGK